MTELKRIAIVLKQHICSSREPVEIANIRATGYVGESYTGTEVRCNRCGHALEHTILFDVETRSIIEATVVGKTANAG